MKKIGTITSSLGLIFFGIWMIIYKSNANLGNLMFKLWPLIFVALGVEILFSLKVRKEEERFKVNHIIIPVILLFLFTNIYISVKDKGYAILEGFNKINVADIINIKSNSKKVSFEKSLNSKGKSVTIDATNGEIIVRKSVDNKISLKGEVYLKGSSDGSYNLNYDDNTEGYKFHFNDNHIKLVKATIYLPEGYDLHVDGTNMSVKQLEEFKLNAFIDLTNGNVELKGDIEKASVDLTNGNVNINNIKCKDIKIDLTNGNIDLKTKDKDIKVKADTSIGVCKLNGEKSRRLDTTLGNGSGTVQADITNGTINIDTQE